MKKENSNNTWTIVFRIIVAVAIALLGVIGGTEAYAALAG